MVHREDVESHLRSVEEDLEYWRTKRLEPRVFRLLRKGNITFSDIIQASSKATARSSVMRQLGRGSIGDRVAALETGLGSYIRGIEVATSTIGSLVLVEESRDEAGVYNETLKFVHRRLSGSIEDRTSQLEKLLREDDLLLQALLVVLTQKGMATEEKLSEMLESTNPPRFENGAKIVAKAWADPEFKSKLIGDAKRTLREMGFALNRTPKLVVVEDTVSTHNVIVCTLCSCYPYELLGNPPWWYKHDNYKQAIVKDPRGTLERDFKLHIPKGIEVRVYDSTSDIRYMVLPKRPEGADGMGEEELTTIVTQESLIGVGETRSPTRNSKNMC